MDKVNQKIKENLFSVNTQTVISAINEIKEKGNKLYIPILFDLLNSKPEKEIEVEIKTLLATVKDKSTAPTFIEAIENAKYKPILKTILTVCWQNGLDFSSYLPVFIDIIIREDWEIAFEAFTIIDNIEFLPKQKIIDESKLQIKNGLETANDQKAYFLQEVLVKIG